MYVIKWLSNNNKIIMLSLFMDPIGYLGHISPKSFSYFLKYNKLGKATKKIGAIRTQTRMKVLQSYQVKYI